MSRFDYQHKQGNTLVEVLIAAAIFGLIITGFIQTLSSLAFVQLKTKARLESILMAKEYIEIAYNLSLQDWDEFSSYDGTYHIQKLPTADTTKPFPYYQLQSGSEIVNGTIERSLEIGSVYRDVNGVIVTDPSLGTLDPDTKEVIVNSETLNNTAVEPITYKTYFIKLEKF